MDDFPKEFCGLWIDEEGKAIYIVKTKPQEFRTAIIFDINSQLENNSIRIDEHLKQLLTRWVLDENRGVHRLQIEAGIQFVGPTYNIYLAKKDEKPADFILNSFNTDNLVLYPEVQMGLYDDWEDDLGVPWGFPYKNFKKASKEIEKKFRILVEFDNMGLII